MEGSGAEWKREPLPEFLEDHLLQKFIEEIYKAQRSNSYISPGTNELDLGDAVYEYVNSTHRLWQFHSQTDPPLKAGAPRELDNLEIKQRYRGLIWGPFSIRSIADQTVQNAAYDKDLRLIGFMTPGPSYYKPQLLRDIIAASLFHHISTTILQNPFFFLDEFKWDDEILPEPQNPMHRLYRDLLEYPSPDNELVAKTFRSNILRLLLPKHGNRTRFQTPTERCIENVTTSRAMQWRRIDLFQLSLGYEAALAEPADIERLYRLAGELTVDVASMSRTDIKITTLHEFQDFPNCMFQLPPKFQFDETQPGAWMSNWGEHYPRMITVPSQHLETRDELSNALKREVRFVMCPLVENMPYKIKGRISDSDSFMIWPAHVYLEPLQLIERSSKEQGGKDEGGEQKEDLDESEKKAFGSSDLLDLFARKSKEKGKEEGAKQNQMLTDLKETLVPKPISSETSKLKELFTDLIKSVKQGVEQKENSDFQKEVEKHFDDLSKTEPANRPVKEKGEDKEQKLEVDSQSSPSSTNPEKAAENSATARGRKELLQGVREVGEAKAKETKGSKEADKVREAGHSSSPEKSPLPPARSRGFFEALNFWRQPWAFIVQLTNSAVHYILFDTIAHLWTPATNSWFVTWWRWTWSLFVVSLSFVIFAGWWTGLSPGVGSWFATFVSWRDWTWDMMIFPAVSTFSTFLSVFLYRIFQWSYIEPTANFIIRRISGVLGILHIVYVLRTLPTRLRRFLNISKTYSWLSKWFLGIGGNTFISIIPDPDPGDDIPSYIVGSTLGERLSKSKLGDMLLGSQLGEDIKSSKFLEAAAESRLGEMLAGSKFEIVLSELKAGEILEGLELKNALSGSILGDTLTGSKTEQKLAISKLGKALATSKLAEELVGAETVETLTISDLAKQISETLETDLWATNVRDWVSKDPGFNSKRLVVGAEDQLRLSLGNILTELPLEVTLKGSKLGYILTSPGTEPILLSSTPIRAGHSILVNTPLRTDHVTPVPVHPMLDSITPAPVMTDFRVEHNTPVIKYILPGYGTPVVDPVIPILTTMGTVFLKPLAPIVAFLSGVPSNIKQLLGGVLDYVSGYTTPMVEPIIPVLTRIKTSFLEKIALIANPITPIVARILPALTQIVTLVERSIAPAVAFFSSLRFYHQSLEIPFISTKLWVFESFMLFVFSVFGAYYFIYHYLFAWTKLVDDAPLPPEETPPPAGSPPFAATRLNLPGSTSEWSETSDDNIASLDLRRVVIATFLTHNGILSSMWRLE
ncbi:hypothetical protein DID88_007252 [Monilinia fructigena]|uniref:Uncharacterized protein n=1 Tax=Monilinia fructigena TaxID=38457 RepID=A0A395J8T2_9HELO|nr:hypothetical protein DID88_007252 [Monilinia fructigena]